jgi:hypothetical protein
MFVDADTGQPLSEEEQDQAELNPAYYTWVKEVVTLS